MGWAGREGLGNRLHVMMVGLLVSVEHSCDAERVLFSYGFGTSVPAHSKRRLQQR